MADNDNGQVLTGTTGHETERITVQGLQAALQKLKTNIIDGKADQSTTYTKSEVNGLIQNFITKSVNDLVNYYLKSETYSASEVDQLLAAIQQFRYEVVSTLPTASAQTMGKIYLVPATSTKTRNVNDEFITIATTETVDNEEVTTYSWEQIGSTTIDLSNYYTKTQTDSAIASTLNRALSAYTTTTDLNTLLAGKQNTIDSSHKLSADLVDDSQSTSKFVSQSEKQTWNGKQDALEFNTTPSSSNKVATMADIPSGAAAYTPTLQSAPTTSTTTYTKDGQTVTFEIGQFARVADASADAGYVMYQLYDLNNGVATWQELGSPLERVRITLLADSSAAPSALRSAATIKITSAKSGVIYNDTIPTDGVTIAKIEPNDTYTVEAEDVNGYITPQTQSFTAELAGVNNVSINYIDSDLSHATVVCADQTYSGSAKTPTPVVTLNGNVIPSSNYDVAYSNNTNAGTATVTVTGKGDYSGTGTGTFTIAKAAPTYTAPTGVQLTYSGSAQEVISAGSTSDGTIQYSSDGENWSTTRPTGTNAGSYTAYWKLVGDANHTDVASTQVSSAIAKADASYTAPTVASLTYNGQEQALLTAGSTSDGTLQYSADGENWSTNIPTGTNAGSYTSYWRIVGDANHNDKASVSLSTTIAKASRTIAFTTAPTEVDEGDTITVAASVSAGAGDGTISYSSGDTSIATISGSTVTGVGGGTVSITATVAEGTNYLSASASYNLTVASSILYAYVKIDQTQSGDTAMITVSDTEGGAALTCPTTSSATHPNAAIQALRDATHLFMGTFSNGTMTLRQLQDADGTKYLDGTTAKFDGTEGDHWMRICVDFYVKRVSGSDSGNQVTYGIAVGGQPDSTWKQIVSPQDLLAVHEAYISGTSLYSRSGVQSGASQTRDTFKQYARNRGTGFQIVTWEWHCVMALLFYAWYGRTNSQAQCGTGANSYTRTLGTKDSLGMTDTTASNGNADNTKFWGIENWWGDKYEWVDNVDVNNRVWTIKDINGNTKRTGITASSISSQYITKMLLSENLDLIPTGVGGSETTYYCDIYYCNSSSRVVARSYSGAYTYGGVASVHANYGSSYTYGSIGSRLAFSGSIEIA